MDLSTATQIYLDSKMEQVYALINDAPELQKFIKNNECEDWKKHYVLGMIYGIHQFNDLSLFLQKNAFDMSRQFFKDRYKVHKMK